MTSTPSSPTPQADPSTANHQIRRALLILVAAMPLHVLYLTHLALPISKAGDFLMFYTAGRVTLTGRSPYQSGVIETDHPVFRDFGLAYHRWAHLTEPIPKELWLWKEGLHYPPQAYLLFVPFSRPPWDVAVVAWLAFLTLLAVSCGTLSWTVAPGSRHRSPVTQTLVALAFLFNPVTQNSLASGQTTILLCAGVALGQWALRQGHPWLGSLFWSFCAVKPHIGFELLALSLLAGGWRFTARVGLWILGLNVLGGLLTTGDPLMVLQMFPKARTYIPDYLQSPSCSLVVGWNRIVCLCTGVAIDLTPARQLASHLVWMGLVSGFAAIRGGLRGSFPYWLAAAACGSPLCTTAHNYDLVLLVLVVPYLFWLWERGQTGEVAVLLALLAAVSVPSNAVHLVLPRLHMGAWGSEMLVSYRPFLLLGIAIYLLVLGPSGRVRSRGGEQVPGAAGAVTQA